MLYDSGFLISSLLVLQLIPNAAALLDFLKFDHGRFSRRADSFKAFDVNPNGSTFLWVPQDEYAGKNFFDGFGFYDGADPTHGMVNSYLKRQSYVNASTAFGEGLAFVRDDGVAVIKGDDTNWLADGEYRKSVRISTYAQYNTGLFILDTNTIPWGCGKIIPWAPLYIHSRLSSYMAGVLDAGLRELAIRVHDNQHNQVAWHTAPGCMLNPNASFTGTVVQDGGTNNTDCNGLINNNAGCGITEWSRASYGPLFDQQGGGVVAMKWDENGIAVWSFFRAAVPQDIVANAPNPSLWGEPSALLMPQECDPIQYFKNHSIIINITFCGDWAGNSYATSGCPGTCAERLKNPANFANASWNINHLRVYRKQLFNGHVSAAVPLTVSPSLVGMATLIMGWIVSLAYLGL
ncbi:hypothetical protein VNI00_001571 [Paramarasmius palmivorus]|uniref:Glycoside hydrolase family 16 protein n=1 Tax=Paramarasmius palmivorus TaxID=297713 RepID=A0AAW0E4V1_9AGAR